MFTSQMYYVVCPRCSDPVGPITGALKQPKVTCLCRECNYSFRFSPEDVCFGTVSRDRNPVRLRLETFEHLMA